MEQNKNIFEFVSRVYILETVDEMGKKKWISFETFDELNRIIKEQPMGVSWEYGYRYTYGNNPILFKNLEEVNSFIQDLDSDISLDSDYEEYATIEEDYIINSKEDYLKIDDYDITFFSSIGKYTYLDNEVRFANEYSKKRFEDDLEGPTLQRKIS